MWAMWAGSTKDFIISTYLLCILGDDIIIYGRQLPNLIYLCVYMFIQYIYIPWTLTIYLSIHIKYSIRIFYFTNYTYFIFISVSNNYALIIITALVLVLCWFANLSIFLIHLLNQRYVGNGNYTLLENLWEYLNWKLKFRSSQISWEIYLFFLLERLIERLDKYAQFSISGR